MIYKDFIACDENLDNFLDYIKESFSNTSLTSKEKMQIEIASEEIFINIAHYAYNGEKGNMSIGIDKNEDRIIYEFKDKGINFDPLAKEKPDLDSSAEEREIGGLGIYMVKSYMDDVKYRYENNYNILTLTKNLRKEVNIVEKDGLVISLNGRIDSSNASNIESSIQDKIKNTDKKIILDATNLEYISSAGLRIILRIKKDHNNISIVNVNNDVYEIFEMTGFNEMIDISKAYRVLSVDGCEIIGQGANGKVYRLDPDTIIKVYMNPDSLDDIHRERELARKAFVLGIPTAIPYDVVMVGNSYGSVFELLNAKSFSKLIAFDESNLDKCVDMSVDLLKKIHSTIVQPTDMPNEKDVVVGWVNFLKDYLPIDKANKLIKLVNDLKETNNMLHGDYHIKNIMLQNNEVLLIDMDTLCYGNPIFEFASMFNAYDGFSYGIEDDTITFLGIKNKLAKEFYVKSLQKYFNTTDKDIIQSIYDKSALIGYSRIMRRSIRRGGLDNEDGKKLINHCKEEILRLIDKLDTLEI